MTSGSPHTHMRLDAEDFREQPLNLCGKAFIADHAGCLYWPAQDALVVADLHLEKCSSHARLGQMLPPYDTRETLARLAAVLDRRPASTVIALGDSLHDAEAVERITADDLASLRILQEERDWIWITGNHDAASAGQLGGVVMEELTVEGITLRHMPHTGRVTHEIAGHMHPAARLSRLGHTLRRPCFAGTGQRLILPAFGALTGGLNVLDAAFEPLMGSDGMKVWMLGHDGIYPIAARLLRPD